MKFSTNGALSFLVFHQLSVWNKLFDCVRDPTLSLSLLTPLNAIEKQFLFAVY